MFPPKENKHFGFNIYAFLGENESLLIDSGFEMHGRTVNGYLSSEGYPPHQVIISHFHHDHIFGLKAMPGIKVYGSKHFQLTLDLYTRPESHARFTPDTLLTDGDILSFGDFKLKFLVMPGHASCNVYTLINDQFIHIGDDLMTSNEGVALLPSVELTRIGEHIASLEKLKEYSKLTFLLSHGPPLQGEDVVLGAITNRLHYLRAVESSKQPVTIDEALVGCTCEFLHKEWHDYLYQD
jgi:glyoxylase-like metal-dependent hydrolase (beta-lactamase superfamily II)